MIFWLWEAPGTGGGTSACGVSGDQAGAREAARACLASGNAAVATLQAATLVSNQDKTDPYYARFGSRWQASRAGNGAIRWRELTTEPATRQRQ